MAFNRKKLIRIGVIGSNEGNGHPISFSSIFNGYDPYYINKYCKFDLIKEYLPKYHQNKTKNIINDAKVTSIWTQSKKNSYEIAKMVNINHICKDLNEMSEHVDAVILARDDINNHLKMIKIFFKKKIPIFIDKLIVPDKKSFNKFNSISKKNLYMSCSSSKYTDVLKKQKKNMLSIKKNTLFVSGYSKKNWIRYAHHLLEGISEIFGVKIKKVRCLNFKNNNSESYQLIYYSGLNVYLHFNENFYLPIHFTCFRKNSEPLYIPYEDYFFSIKEMMINFKKMIRNKNFVIPVNHMDSLTRIVIAGNLSKKNNLKFYSPKTLEIVK